MPSDAASPPSLTPPGETVAGCGLRVLHVGKYAPPYAGGIEHFVIGLAAAQMRSGVSVACLLHRTPRGRRRREPMVCGGAEAHTATGGAVPIYGVPSYGTVAYAPVSPQFPLCLRRAVRAMQPQLLHLHLPNLSAFWALGSRAARRLPWIVHWHSDVDVSSQRRVRWAYPAYRVFEQAMLRQASAIIATSSAYAGASRALQPWQEKVHVIPLGIDPGQPRAPAPAAMAEAQQLWQGWPEARLLAVGRLSYYKGHETLIEAVARVPGARLVIVGEGELRARFQRLIRSYGVEARVHLGGALPDEQRDALLATCDVFCLPSIERTEAFGLSQLEAMRYAIPVLASRIPGSGVTEVVSPGVTGLLVPPGDAPAWADAIRRLAHAPAWRQALGRAGYQRLQARYTLPRVVEEIDALYRRVLVQEPRIPRTDLR